MACDSWTGKIDAYVDGELPPEEARVTAEHVRGCTPCTLRVLQAVEQKRMVRLAGQRFLPDPKFRAKLLKRIESRPYPRNRAWLPALAGAVAALLVVLFIISSRNKDQQTISELVDLHVATLASPNPVDVVSSDRHTVKPWFQGKIPFTFNLPELEGAPFTLIGGRVAYLGQSPGAELLYRVRQHQISVFLFQEKDLSSFPESAKAPYFHVRSWTQNGLRYFLVGDASVQDLNALEALFRKAE